MKILSHPILDGRGTMKPVAMAMACLIGAGWVSACATSQVAARPTAPPAQDPRAARNATLQAQRLGAQADVAYDDKRYAECAAHNEEAVRLWPGKATHFLYGAACCHALAGHRDAAFRALEEALRRGYSNVDYFLVDNDLASLRTDPRWPSFYAAAQARRERHVATLHAELYRMFQEDQKSRTGGFEKIDWKVVSAQDEKHRQRATQILAEGGAKTSDDYYHAAMIFQHGSAPADFEQAHKLAVKAVELDASNDAARWLAAATQDRFLMNQNKPQLYGTQFKKVDGKWILYPVDPSITDEERAQWNVPPLDAAKRRAEALNHQ
jgi:hypothetical protein